MVDETVAGRAGRPLHDVELGLLVGDGDGGHHVVDQVHGVESGGGILKTTQVWGGVV